MPEFKGTGGVVATGQGAVVGSPVQINVLRDQETIEMFTQLWSEARGALREIEAETHIGLYQLGAAGTYV